MVMSYVIKPNYHLLRNHVINEMKCKLIKTGYCQYCGVCVCMGGMGIAMSASGWGVCLGWERGAISPLDVFSPPVRYGMLEGEISIP